MKKRSILLATTALFILPVGGAFGAGDAGMSGSVELGARLAADEDDGAKFMEYRDLESGVIGNFMYNYYRDALFFDVEAANIGLDDQYYRLEGGLYNTLKFWLFYDEIPHNLSFDARTFYSGVGGGDLNTARNPADESTWRTFDYTIDTEQFGGGAEFLQGSPYFVRFNVSQENKEGVRPLGSGSFSGVVEMPEPVDHTTNNVSLAGGYRSDTISYSISGMYSSFDNDNNALEWDNPFIGITEHNSLAQDSDYGKFGADFTWHQLPMMSTLRLRGTYTTLSSDFHVSELGASIPAGLNSLTFDGDVTTARFNAALFSHPTDSLETKVFFEYFDRDNDSTVIEYTGGGNDIHLYEYDRYNLGFDVGYDLVADTTLGGGYTFEEVDRTNRHDAESNSDHEFFVNVKNKSLDFLTAKVEYTYLNRDTDEDFDLAGVTPLDAEYIVLFVDRFDAASKSKHELEFAVEVYPFRALDFGASYTYVNNDYDDAILGRTEDSGHELYVDAMWRAAKFLSLGGFAGYERYESDSNHYNYRAGFQGQTANPLVDDGNPDSFRWSQFDEEDYWTLGLTAKMPLMRDRLVLSFLAQYQESDGESDFTTEGATPLESIDEFEDYYIATFEARASYAFTEAWALNLGYLFEKSNYDDRQYEGYDLSPGGTYLSGAYADHDYDAHVGYVTLKYSF